MRIRKLVGVAATGAVAAGMLALGSPAQADFTNGLTIEVTRSGTSPIVSGSGTTTEFTVVITNPADNASPKPVHVQGAGESGLTMVNVESVNGRLDCTDEATYFDCTAYNPPSGIEPPDVQNGAGGAEWLLVGESTTVKVTYFAEAWVPTSTKTFCGALATADFASPAEFTTAPCGIQADAPSAGEPQEEPSPWTEKTATVDVKALADLQLTATGASQTDPGKEATVSFQLKDLGPSLVLGYTISFTLPDGLTLVSAGPDPWKCNQTGQKVECVWNAVRAPATQFAPPSLTPLEVKVKTPNPALKADYGIQATATSNVEDPTPANAISTGGIPMTPVDLAVTKQAGSPVFVGDEATYSVVLTNVGTIADLGKLSIVDTLPAGAEFKSATGEGWSCKADGQKVTCADSHGELAVGASDEVLIVAKMTTAGRPENKVEVSTTAYEKNLANNSTSKVVRVVRAAQTAGALPPSPRRILSGKTDQGQKLTTRVRCTPVKASAAGEVSYCSVHQRKGVVHVHVHGTTTMKVKVVQSAKGTKSLKPFVQRKTYLVKP